MMITLQFIVGIFLASLNFLQAWPSLSDLERRMAVLASEYPQYVSLTTAQAMGVPSPGTCKMKGEEFTKCFQTVADVGFFEAHHTSTPQVFVSGALHGDEVVGPDTVVSFVEALVRSGANSTRSPSNDWARRMLRTRLLTVMPTANVKGYSDFTREENGVDVNRDFGFDTNPDNCMVSTAAQAISTVWASRLFRLAITFHGGDYLVSWPWGDTVHCQGSPGPLSACQGGWECPDADPAAMLGNILADSSGPSPEIPSLYRRGATNDVIYPVQGGMEDWAYGGSWSDLATNCSRQLPSGYAHDENSLRALNFLVETSMSKQPPDPTFGSVKSIQDIEQEGHVPRNAKMIAHMVDLAEPYVVQLGSIPSAEAANNSFVEAFVHQFHLPENFPDFEQATQTLDYTVFLFIGGCLTVDDVQVNCVKDKGIGCHQPRISPLMPEEKCHWVPSYGFGKLVMVYVGCPDSLDDCAVNIKIVVDIALKQSAKKEVFQSHWSRQRSSNSYRAHRSTSKGTFSIQAIPELTIEWRRSTATFIAESLGRWAGSDGIASSSVSNNPGRYSAAIQGFAFIVPALLLPTIVLFALSYRFLRRRFSNERSRSHYGRNSFIPKYKHTNVHIQ